MFHVKHWKPEVRVQATIGNLIALVILVLFIIFGFLGMVPWIMVLGIAGTAAAVLLK